MCTSLCLHTSVQGTTHDAIEDARTALLLYRKYQELVADGTFDNKLTEVYQWGQAYGWEPVTLDAQGRPVPPTAALTAAPIPALG
jgi:PAB-dependent poly(A)-specific ribonuclease subunit 2